MGNCSMGKSRMTKLQKGNCHLAIKMPICKMGKFQNGEKVPKGKITLRQNGNIAKWEMARLQNGKLGNLPNGKNEENCQMANLPNSKMEIVK